MSESRWWSDGTATWHPRVIQKLLWYSNIRIRPAIVVWRTTGSCDTVRDLSKLLQFFVQKRRAVMRVGESSRKRNEPYAKRLRLQPDDGNRCQDDSSSLSMRVSIPDNSGLQKFTMAHVRDPSKDAQIASVNIPSISIIKRFKITSSPYDHSTHACLPFEQARSCGQALPQGELADEHFANCD